MRCELTEIVRDILRYVRDTLEHDPNTMFQLRLDEVQVFDRSVAMVSISTSLNTICCDHQESRRTLRQCFSPEWEFSPKGD